MATLSINHIPNPVSLSVKTAGYTIPANRYARAVVSVNTGGTFSVNGVTALSSDLTSWSVLASDNLKITATRSGVVAGGLYVDQAGPGVSPGLAGAAFNESTAYMYTSLVHDFFLPSGTVINGAGTWKASVEEYSINGAV